MAKRGEKVIKMCVVCGDKAKGINFNALTCMSCKAFFRRNALRNKEMKCPFNDSCKIDLITRKFCSKCRLKKCFECGMKKEWILSDEEKRLIKEKIMRNKLRRLEESQSQPQKKSGNKKSATTTTAANSNRGSNVVGKRRRNVNNNPRMSRSKSTANSNSNSSNSSSSNSTTTTTGNSSISSGSSFRLSDHHHYQEQLSPLLNDLQHHQQQQQQQPQQQPNQPVRGFTTDLNLGDLSSQYSSLSLSAYSFFTEPSSYSLDTLLTSDDSDVFFDSSSEYGDKESNPGSGGISITNPMFFNRSGSINNNNNCRTKDEDCSFYHSNHHQQQNQQSLQQKFYPMNYSTTLNVVNHHHTGQNIKQELLINPKREDCVSLPFISFSENNNKTNNNHNNGNNNNNNNNHSNSNNLRFASSSISSSLNDCCFLFSNNIDSIDLFDYSDLGGFDFPNHITSNGGGGECCVEIANNNNTNTNQNTINGCSITAILSNNNECNNNNNNSSFNHQMIYQQSTTGQQQSNNHHSHSSSHHHHHNNYHAIQLAKPPQPPPQQSSIINGLLTRNAVNEPISIYQHDRPRNDEDTTNDKNNNNNTVVNRHCHQDKNLENFSRDSPEDRSLFREETPFETLFIHNNNSQNGKQSNEMINANNNKSVIDELDDTIYPDHHHHQDDSSIKCPEDYSQYLLHGNDPFTFQSNKDGSIDSMEFQTFQPGNKHPTINSQQSTFNHQINNNPLKVHIKLENDQDEEIDAQRAKVNKTRGSKHGHQAKRQNSCSLAPYVKNENDSSGNNNNISNHKSMLNDNDDYLRNYLSNSDQIEDISNFDPVIEFLPRISATATNTTNNPPPPQQPSLREIGFSNRELILPERCLIKELSSACSILHNPYKRIIYVTDPGSKTTGFSHQCSITEFFIHRMIRMAKRLSSFSNLTLNDQVRLLKCGLLEMLVIRSALLYDPDRDAWCFLDDKCKLSVMVNTDIIRPCCLKCEYQRHKNFLNRFMHEWKNDTIIFDLLTAMILFTPRLETEENEKIKEEHLRYTYLLRRYLEIKYPNINEAKSTFARLMSCIDEVHCLMDDVTRLFVSISRLHKSPLFAEILDLPQKTSFTTTTTSTSSSISSSSPSSLSSTSISKNQTTLDFIMKNDDNDDVPFCHSLGLGFKSNNTTNTNVTLCHVEKMTTGQSLNDENFVAKKSCQNTFAECLLNSVN